MYIDNGMRKKVERTDGVGTAAKKCAKVRSRVRVCPDVKEKLARLAKCRGVCMSELVETLIREEIRLENSK